MMRNLLLAVTLLFSEGGLCQGPKLSGPELCWALLHPIAAIKVKNITDQNAKLIDQKKISADLDSFSNGGKADAFRHSFNMASYAQKIRTKKLRKLGQAHERSNYKQFKRSKLEYGEVPDSLSSVMDLQNNELGLAIGCANRKASRDDLMTKVLVELKAGKGVIMRRNRAGKFLDCKGLPIDINSLGKKWNIPKCLVSSDYHYQD